MPILFFAVPPPAPDVHLKKAVPQIAKNSTKEVKKEELKKAPVKKKVPIKKKAAVKKKEPAQKIESVANGSDEEKS